MIWDLFCAGLAIGVIGFLFVGLFMFVAAAWDAYKKGKLNFDK